VTPLREGGSLPGIVEADDYGTYVVKFRGAGQGLKALVAEVVVGELARRLDLPVPELVAVELAPEIGKYEADQEVQDLLNASVGLNLGVDFLPGSFGWDGWQTSDGSGVLAEDCATAEDRQAAVRLAAQVLWLDAFTANVDRSWRNPNVLIWHRKLWLIDHGAALYFHHGWGRSADRPLAPGQFAIQPYDASDHIMRAHLAEVAAADRELAPRVTPALLAEVLAQVPDEWLEPVPGVAGLDTVAEVRQTYVDYLHARVSGRREWLPRPGARTDA
jgi:hypothetical protein